MSNSNDLLWGYLVHLSYNMWGDREPTEDPNRPPHWCAQPVLRFDDLMWDAIIEKSLSNGLNMMVIDVGDGIHFDSHPEISVRGAWTHDRLRKELKRLRDSGLEPIPKLNFSTCHDVWLGPYSRCVSSDLYYKVCSDVITETAALFDKPRFFHLGLDEETIEHQRSMSYAVIRQHELWWHDFRFYLDAVTLTGSRPWIWSDYLWRHTDDFLANVPKAVLQSNWYYGKDFNPDESAVKAYAQLEEHGYDQIPTGSNWSHPENFEKTTVFCKPKIAHERLHGFLQTSWRPTLNDFHKHHTEAIEQVGRAIRAWNQTGDRT